MSAICAGSENTTWKYGTGSSSASRAASHSLAVAPWHFGAMPVAARVIGDLCVAAVLVRRHHPERLSKGELAEADMAGIGLTPCRSMAAEDIRNLQRWTGQGRGPLCRRRVFPALGLLARLRQQVERALDTCDHAGGDARIARRRI